MSLLGIAVTVISFPFNLLKWLWDLLKVGQLKMQLQKELKQLQNFKYLRDSQLANLRGYNTSLLKLRLDSISLDIGGTGAEPFIGITMTIFNGSMFTIQLKNPSFTARLNSNLLPLTPRMLSDLPRLFPGNTASFTLNQPIQEPTQLCYETWVTLLGMMGFGKGCIYLRGGHPYGE